MNARLAVSCILLVILAACAYTDQPTRSAMPGGYYYKHEPTNDPLSGATPTNLELPPIPSGCVARVYHIKPRSFSDAPRTKTDWADFLRARGMVFPHGGFAVYFVPTATLIVANTPDQLALLDPF